jgi:branched-subunit amino acid ABC-type transport system permease component
VPKGCSGSRLLPIAWMAKYRVGAMLVHGAVGAHAEQATLSAVRGKPKYSAPLVALSVDVVLRRLGTLRVAASARIYGLLHFLLDVLQIDLGTLGLSILILYIDAHFSKRLQDTRFYTRLDCANVGLESLLGDDGI